MTSEYANQVTVGLLLLSLLSVVAIGLIGCLVAVLHHHRRRMIEVAEAGRPRPKVEKKSTPSGAHALRWAVVKSTHAADVQAALGLHNAVPCSWAEGMAARHQRLFIAPPVGGWVLIMGSGLPDPVQDVDECFHFVVSLSRAMGTVQFFCLDQMHQHHAWVQAEAGRIVRAYAWAAHTLWNQGEMTPAELGLGLKCYGYGESPASSEPPGCPTGNTAKVPALAQQWSFDPLSLNEHLIRVGRGVTGDLTHFKLH